VAGCIGLAEVLRRLTPAYLETRALSPTQAKAWRAILACRTAALGGHVECCEHCGATRHFYHSCRNRHCPQRQSLAKERWLQARRAELLPVPYFHLVFTLPHVLNGLIGRHARAVYQILFGAASATLTEFAANPRWLGGTPSFTLVLHTWKQDLGRHVHVHALVAGGALNAEGRWLHPRRGFLFPVKALSRVFRGKFLAALDSARTSGRLAQHECLPEATWHALLARLRAHDWVVYAKAPLGGPAAVLDYLARYTHRVAISNERILGMDNGEVSFRVRADTSRKKRVVRLSAAEFIDRFLLHVLPPGFKRIRHYGLLGPTHKAARLAAARAALDAPAPEAQVVESVEEFLRRVARLEYLDCPHCGRGRFVFLQTIVPLQAPWIALRAPP
jgi:hypothetical protein